jgi:hypothetical protein
MPLQVTPGDIADRYSILQLKATRLAPSKEVEAELRAYETAAKEIGLASGDVWPIMTANSQIWFLEADIRSGKEGQLPISQTVLNMPPTEMRLMAEIGLRALQIRAINGIRVDEKNKINEKFGHVFREVKGEHASAA